MIVEVERNGRRHAVDVRRDGDRWVVTLDGRAIAVSVTVVGDRWSLLLGPAEAGHHVPENVASGFSRTAVARSYEVSIERRGAEHVVHVNGHALPLTILRGGSGSPKSRRSGDGSVAGAAKIVAPMPGRIVKVLVKAGDPVEAQQGLVVVEAMKMENELRAPRPGTVSEVRVREGMSVEAAAVLVVIE